MAWLFMPRAFDILTSGDIYNSYVWGDLTALYDLISETLVEWEQDIAPPS